MTTHGVRSELAGFPLHPRISRCHLTKTTRHLGKLEIMQSRNKHNLQTVATKTDGGLAADIELSVLRDIFRMLPTSRPNESRAIAAAGDSGKTFLLRLSGESRHPNPGYQGHRG